MAKYEQVEFSKEKPKKSGWYYFCDSDRTSDMCSKRYYSHKTGQVSSNEVGMHSSTTWSYWFRKVRPTTGLTAVQALKAMQRGECVIGKGHACRPLKMIDGKIHVWLEGFKNFFWDECRYEINTFNKYVYSIVSDPSKELEPEREEFGFGEFYSRLCAGKTCGVATGKAKYKMVNGNVQDTAFNETCPLTADWQNFQYYEVQE